LACWGGKRGREFKRNSAQPEKKRTEKEEMEKGKKKKNNEKGVFFRLQMGKKEVGPSEKVSRRKDC